MGINDNFGSNRQKYRKVYSYGGTRKPDIRTFVDSETGTTQSQDFQKVIRDRSFYIIRGQVDLTFPPADPAPAEYLETTVSMGSIATSVAIIFPTPFSAPPVVSVTLEPLASGLEYDINVSYWITDITTTGFTANFSSRFRGNVTYRATNITYPDIFFYPIYVQRLPAHSGSYAWVSAGSMSLNYQSALTMSWPALPTTPEYVGYNPVGVSADTNLDMGLTSGSATVGTITGDLSTQFSGVVHFLVLDTT